jgi:hypothetical protein
VKRLLLLVALCLLGFLLFRTQAPVPAPEGPLERPQRPDVVVSSPGAFPSAPGGERDPFRYVDDPGPLPRSRPTVHPPLTNLPSPSPLKLLGFMRDRRGLQAVLSIGSEVELGSVGDALEGYLVLSVDEDSGVRLRDPEGREITLPPS